MPFFRTIGSPDSGCARRNSLSPSLKSMFEMMQEEADRTGDPIDWELTKSLWLGSEAGFLAMFRTQGDREKVHWNDVHDTNIIRLNGFQRMQIRGSHMKFVEPSENAYRNPSNEYWRIRRYYKNLNSWEKKSMSTSYHPLIVPSVECFYQNSELLLRELDYEFDLCRGKSGEYFKKAVYVGSDPNYFRHWFSNGTPSIEYAEYIVEGKCWDDMYRSCRFDANLFRNLSIFLREESRRLAYDFVFCDYSTVGKVDTTEELQNNYFMFKQMFHSFETLDEGGKLLVRVPSMFHQVTRDILTVFSAHFERYKILKPVATPLGCEDVYVCFDGKRFFRDNQESILFLASLNLYFDEYNKTNAIQKQTDSLTLSTIFSPRERNIFERETQEFTRHFELTKEYMRSEFVDIQSFKMKQRIFTTEERKILTDRFFTYLEVAKAYEETFCDEPSDSYIVSENEVIVVEEHDADFKVQQSDFEKTAHEILDILVNSKILMPDFPRKELLTNHGFFKDLLAMANKTAYAKGNKDFKVEEIMEMAVYNNNCKRFLIDYTKNLNTIIDLACGKGVDVQKYSGGSSNVTTYIGMDICQQQLEDFKYRDPQVRFSYELYKGDFTQPRILPGLQGRTCIAAYNVFSLLCTSKLAFNTWLRYNFRFKDIVLIGSCLSKTVLKNEEYIKRFSCKFNGNLMQYTIPGLVTNAYEYVLDLDEVKKVAIDAQMKMVVFGFEKFPTLYESLSPVVQEMVKDIRYVMLCKHDALDDLVMKKLWTNLCNPNFFFRQ